MSARLLILALPLVAAITAFDARVAAQRPIEPVVGQPGKDAVWVPTTSTVVEKMLDMAQVTPRDFVIDLGSGDGRMVIAAARRGARALGVEYDEDLVELSRQLALDAGVADKATFVRGDMFEADISEATVLALFLLPENLERLRDKFLALRPGTRIVLNTLGIPGWDPDAREQAAGDCAGWCTALLHIVPARVAGIWGLPAGELAIDQQFQIVSGTLSSAGRTVALRDGRVRGDRITFAVDDLVYEGRVTGDRIEGTAGNAERRQSWMATRRP
jgi:SAM-dependent methyltransferase